MRRGWAKAAWLAPVLAVLAGCGGGGGGAGAGGGGGNPPAPQPNRLPSFTSAATASVAENASGTIYTATASDPDGNPLTFSLSGGADRARFAISPVGALSFVDPPDFEAPADADGDNVYRVQIAVGDGMGSVVLDLAVTVTNGGPDGFRVRRVASGLSQPLFVAPVPDNSGRLFVVQRGGLIRLLDPATGAVAAVPFLDVSTDLTTDGERGLLGFAAAPDYATSGAFYVFLTTTGGAIEVRRYRTIAGTPDRADPASGDAILRIDHPRNNHNGGWIGFGPDGLLYVAVGDGGGTGDPDRAGQDRNVLRGKILRIDVASDAFPTDPARDYAIPSGNPFAGGGGSPEIWALGLRNPFRCSFDSATGNLLIADVGQGVVEEIDLMRPGDGGANFGWSLLEGTRPFNGQPAAGLTPPVAEYEHGAGERQGNSVTGGYVYRGPIEALRGSYFFADFVRPNIWSLPVSRLIVGETRPASEFVLRNADLVPDAGTIASVASFGVDQAGNLYIVDIGGEIFVIEPR